MVNKDGRRVAAVTGRGATVAPLPVQQGVALRLTRKGARDAVEFFGLSRLSLTKIAAGFPVMPGTTAMAAMRLGITLDHGGDRE